MTFAEVKIMTTVIVRQGLCRNHGHRGSSNQAGLIVKGVSERALVAGAKREDISRWSVPQNSIANQ